MDIRIIGITGVCILLILLFIKMPIGFSMALVGFVGICLIRGADAGLTQVVTIPIRWASSYILSAIPLFMLMGYMAANVGLTRDAFYVANKWIGHVPGGLAVSTVMASAAFGAVCGDAIAGAVTMCSVALPDMRKYNYKDKLSLGCIAAGGNLSFLIPPSIGFIVYAFLTEMSIGQLFIAGILPGILMSLLFSITILIQCWLDPGLAPPSPKATWRERLVSARFLWGFGVLILFVLGGIYAGVVTPTEAAAIGVFGTVVLGLMKRQLSRHAITESFKSVVQLIGMIFMLIIGAQIFNSFLTVSEVSLAVTNFFLHLPVSPWVILAVILLFYIGIGFILDIMAVVMLTVPVLHPVLVSLGFDPVWLGVLVITTVLMGHISPPFGIVVFALGGVVKDVPLFEIFRGALPFLAAMFACLVIVAAFPEIATFLPYLMK